MGRPAIYSKEELRERRNIEKSLYMKARTKLNFVFENEDAIIYKELAKDEELSLATVSELLRLIEVGASCFNHYCVNYDDT